MEKYPCDLPTDILEEAQEFIREAEQNSKPKPENNTPFLPPINLVSDALNILKTKTRVTIPKTPEELCKESARTLATLLREPQKVISKDVEHIMALFESVRNLAFDRAPRHIDMGGYGLLIH